MFLTDAAHPTPHPSRFARHLPLKGKAFGLCESLLHSKSQRTPPLASNIELLALAHTTRLTGGYDYFFLFENPRKQKRQSIRHRLCQAQPKQPEFHW